MKGEYFFEHIHTKKYKFATGYGFFVSITSFNNSSSDQLYVIISNFNIILDLLKQMSDTSQYFHIEAMLLFYFATITYCDTFCNIFEYESYFTNIYQLYPVTAKLGKQAFLSIHDL